jgi:multiple sugar transport system permease protein
MPPSAGMRRLWEKYVRETLNAHYVRIEPGDDPKAGTRLETKFRKFLLARHGSEDRVAAMYLAPSRALRLPLTVGGLRSSTAFNDWDAFVRTIPLESLRIDSSEAIWQRWLKERYGSLESLNAAHGTRCASFGEIPWPQPEIDRLDWERNRPAYLAEILLKNYRRAWSFIAVASPSLWNTLRFAILFTLLSIAVNTAAGYALSRFGSGPGQLALAGLLALAAFPIEAIAVPNFVLLRDMGLLNTVWALVLPAAVNGYYIYLMKGFFDAIPRQCFEDAELEGASEWRMLWLVALPLARPMAAVIALYAFLWSYSNFMWALIVCQQRAQWTLPVFIFNVNSWGATAPLLGAIMVLTTVPPLLMFVFAHRVLQRSLALPRTYV